MRHQDVFLGEADYIELNPPLELMDYVDVCWFYYPDIEAPRRDILIPEGVVDLVFNFGDPYYRHRANDRDGDGDWIAGDVVVGQRTLLFSVEWPKETRLFAIRLRTETAYLFFAMPMHQITNRTKPLQDVGFLELSRAVHKIPYKDQTSIASRAFDFLGALVKKLDKPDARVSTVVENIKRQNGNLDIQLLCDELGLNRRTVERLFADRVGTSPKFLARTVRLHHFLCLQRERREENLTHAAVEAHYYDQSHLIRDFKQFTGESPARFFNSPPDIYEPLLASLLGRQGSDSD